MKRRTPDAERPKPRLKKETLRGLTAPELEQVNGGTPGRYQRPRPTRYCIY